MAMNFPSAPGPNGSRSGGFGYRGRWKRAPIAEINVTPLVDVMLVLLIIFMIAAPLLATGVPVDLPESAASALPEDTTPVQVVIDAEGQLFIDDAEIAPGELTAKLTAIAQARRDDPRLYVRADASLDYGTVMQVIGQINAAGFGKVALVTQPEKR